MPLLLAEQVGSDGLVVATDIDVVWAETARSSNVHVIKHNVVTEQPPGVSFDLIHARLVLVHVPERARALHNIVRALKPGGWLLIEDADPNLQPLACIIENSPAEVLINKLRRGFRELMQRRGVDLSYGRTLPRTLRDAGLEDVMADAYFPIGQPECQALERATVSMLAAQMITAQLASEVEIQTCLNYLDSQKLDIATAPMISAWGRRPAR
jgi:SAM-dependent methyltransferase